jgi:hypothetical protein
MNWDSIPITEKTIAQPAASATCAIAYTVPANRRAKIQLFESALTTSGVAGNRIVVVHVTAPSTAVLWSSATAVARIAGGTWQYVTGPGVALAAAVNAEGYLTLDIPAAVSELPAGSVVEMKILSGGDAGDRWSAGRFLLKEAPG